jgi:hypothetical protein
MGEKQAFLTNIMFLENFARLAATGGMGKKPVTIGWGGIRFFPMTGPVGGNRTKFSRTPLAF